MAKTADTVITRWLNEIDAAKKREKTFRKEGQTVNDTYSGKRIAETPFNILFSNTETLLPACYSQAPRPVVARRFKDEDPLGKSAALAATRVLEFLLDTNVDGYETFDEGMRSATLDALLPGRGVTTIKYDTKFQPMEEGETSDDPSEDDKEDDAEEVAEYKTGELVCVESRGWNKVYFGYAKKWTAVPWVAYELEIDREEAKRIGVKASILAELRFTSKEIDKDDDEEHGVENYRGDRKVLTVYQIWDKDGGRKVRYVCPTYKLGYLKVDDDPLQLTGFFNCPKPIQFIEKSNDLLPVALYALYENQAKELNEITRRINLIIKAIKAKAIYDTSLGDDIKNLVEAEDNDLVPAEAASSLAAEKGFANAIWFWPIDQLAKVLQILVATRDQCKQVIYEVTGISDILRGSTVASETATAQKIKSQWGSLRLKRLQKEVQRYARDLLRMMLEVAATKFSEETWAKMTGLPFLVEEKYNELQSVAQALQMQVQMMQMQMPPPMPGQPPMPPPPQMAQLQQVQAELQKPQWAQVLELLRNDMQRAYRVDIETNSTVEAEATEDKEQMAEVMAAMGQALNGLTPLVTAGALPFEAAQGMILTIVRRFRFGPDVEDMIKAMKQPQPPDQAKQQAQAQMDQMKSQMAKLQQDAQSAVAESNGKVAELELAVAKEKAEKELLKQQGMLELKQIKLNSEEAQFKLEKQYAEHTIANKAKSENDALSMKKQVASMENNKFKTENVINQKLDAKTSESAKAMESIVSQLRDQLLGVMQQQAAEHQGHMENLAVAISKPKRKRAIRGKDGKIESVIEETIN